MKIRSTGLGKTELTCEIQEIATKGGYLIMHVSSFEPVRWHIRCALTPTDLVKALVMSVFPALRCFASHAIRRRGVEVKLEY